MKITKRLGFTLAAATLLLAGASPAGAVCFPWPDCIQFCGDGSVNHGEECDDGIATPTCSAECELLFCGDGITTAEAGEECDSGGSSSAECTDICTIVSCGDGIVTPEAGEECDPAVLTVECTPSCTQPERIYACVNRTNGGLRIAEPTAVCKTYEDPLSWRK